MRVAHALSMREHHVDMQLRADLFVVVLAAASLAGSVAAQPQACDVNGESVNPANGYTTEGKTGIMRCRQGEGGPLVREEELQNGKFMGVQRFYKNGVLERDFHVNERGNKDGRCREFAAMPGPKNPVVLDETYSNGRHTGRSRRFYPDGRLARVVVWGEQDVELASAEFNESGKLSELHCASKPLLAPDVNDSNLCGFGARPSSVDLYGSRGPLRARAVFARGETTRYETFWNDGKLKTQSELSANGKVERSFDEKGTKRSERTFIGRGNDERKAQERIYRENGELQKERSWNPQQQLQLEREWYQNGQLRSSHQAVLYKGRLAMREIAYYDNGKPAADGVWIDREDTYGQDRVGVHRTFDEDGSVRTEQYYDDRGRITRERVWNEDRELTRDDELFEDGSRKAFRK